MTLSDLIELYLMAIVSTRSAQTVNWYRKRLAPLKALGQNVSSITLSDLQCLYAQLATRKARWVNHPSGRAAQPGGLSPVTLRGYVRAWRVFFNWLVDDGVILASPARKLTLPRMPKQPPKAISQCDMERIVEAAMFSSARDYAICCILADSACRVSGLCSLTLDNLDLQRGQAIVVEKGQTRFLIFSQRTIAAICVYLHERPDVSERALFIGQKLQPLGTSGVHSLLDRLAERAGVNGRHNPHAWRHGWARAALANGADLGEVAQVLGHNQVQTTFEFYGRWDSDELHELHERYTWLKEEHHDNGNSHKQSLPD